MICTKYNYCLLKFVFNFLSKYRGYLPYVAAAGELKHKGTENESLSVRGEYSERFKEDFLGKERDIVRNVGYVADEKGFQPFIQSYGVEDHISEQSYIDDPAYPRFQQETLTHFKSLEEYKNVDLPKANVSSFNRESGPYSFR